MEQYISSSKLGLVDAVIALIDVIYKNLAKVSF